VTDPILKPFQRFQIGGSTMGMDFSPLFAILGLNVIGWLCKLLLSLFA